MPYPQEYHRKNNVCGDKQYYGSVYDYLGEGFFLNEKLWVHYLELVKNIFQQSDNYRRQHCGYGKQE